MANARQTVEAESEKIAVAADEKIGGGFRAAGEKIAEATGGIRTMSRAISGTVGVFTSMVGVLTLIGTLIAGIVAAIDRWLDASRKTSEELTKQYRTLDDIQSSIERRRALLAGASEEELAHLELMQQEVQEARKLADLRDEGTIPPEEHARLLRELEAIYQQEHALIERNRAARERAQREQFERGLQNIKDAAEAQRQIDEQIAAEKKEREEKDRREREQRERESAERMAAALEQAFSRAISSLRSRQILDDSNIAASLSNLNEEVKRIGRNLQNIPIQM